MNTFSGIGASRAGKFESEMPTLLFFRYDKENVAAVHGHEDVFWEAAERDEVVELPQAGFLHRAFSILM